jgi:site-specific recombinase XerD
MNETKIKQSYNFHQLRHTGATEFGRKGLDIKAIKTMLDHTDIRTSDGYVEQNLDYIKRRMNEKNQNKIKTLLIFYVKNVEKSGSKKS